MIVRQPRYSKEGFARRGMDIHKRRVVLAALFEEK